MRSRVSKEGIPSLIWVLIVIEIKILVTAAGASIWIVNNVINVSSSETDKLRFVVSKWLRKTRGGTRWTSSWNVFCGEEKDRVGADVSVFGEWKGRSGRRKAKLTDESTLHNASCERTLPTSLQF